MSDLLDKWLLHYDPIHRGWTLAGIMNGVCATGGFFFPRVGGGINLYRGTERRDISLAAGAAGADAETITPFAWLSQAADTAYYFLCRAVGPGGVEAIDDPAAPPATAVRTDGAGEAVEPFPPAPRRLTVVPLAGGRFRLQWEFVPSRNFAEAAEFRVYGDVGTGTMNYAVELDSIALRRSLGGSGAYGWTSAAFGHGLTVQFVVRAATAAGVEETNGVAVAAIADAEGPAGTAVDSCEWEADE